MNNKKRARKGQRYFSFFPFCVLCFDILYYLLLDNTTIHQIIVYSQHTKALNLGLEQETFLLLLFSCGWGWWGWWRRLIHTPLHGFCIYSYRLLHHDDGLWEGGGQQEAEAGCSLFIIIIIIY